MTTTKPVIMLIVGYPASGKSTYAAQLKERTAGETVIISRDVLGGRLDMLANSVKQCIQASKSVILDNTHLTPQCRSVFIAQAKELGVQVHAIYLKTSIEDCQIRALRRMWQKYNEIYLTGKAPFGSVAANDPNVFPPAVLFAARKALVEPNAGEGFDSILKVNIDRPVWDSAVYTNKALFLDIDGTIRDTSNLPYKYPTEAAEVRLLHNAENMRQVLDRYRGDGFMLIGISNQSGIADGRVVERDAVAAFDRTRELLGYREDEFPILYCPHGPVPVRCYCRKPQVGSVVMMLERCRVDPMMSIMVGDMKTDETLAKRVGMKFVWAKDFWKGV